jgi:hypothetical protein
LIAEDLGQNIKLTGLHFIARVHRIIVAAALKPCNQPQGALAPAAQAASAPPEVVVEFPAILVYCKSADEFVRLSCCDHTGWRRDEWAYSPLFICGKFRGFSGHFLQFLGRIEANSTGMPCWDVSQG